MSIDGVGKGKNVFGIPIVILQSNIYVDSLFFSFNVNGFGMNNPLVFILKFYKGNNTPLILELLLFFRAFIGDGDL